MLTEISHLVLDLVEKRDEFIKNNISKISEIENEEIKFLGVANSSNVYAIITLTYYPKE